MAFPFNRALQIKNIAHFPEAHFEPPPTFIVCFFPHVIHILDYIPKW